MRTSWTRRALVVGLTVVVATAVSDAASAQFRDSASSGGLSVSTAQLAPATSLTATAGCVLVTHKVDLAWKATTSPFASGYRVYRRPSSSGTYSLIATVSGASATGYTDATVLAGTSYVYVVEAYRGGWSAGSPGAGVTTRSLCLL